MSEELAVLFDLRFVRHVVFPVLTAIYFFNFLRGSDCVLCLSLACLRFFRGVMGFQVGSSRRCALTVRAPSGDGRRADRN